MSTCQSPLIVIICFAMFISTGIHGRTSWFSKWNCSRVIISNFKSNSFFLQNFVFPFAVNSITEQKYLVDNILLKLSICSNRQDVVRVSGKFDLLDRILPKLKRKNHRYIFFLLSFKFEILFCSFT